MADDKGRNDQGGFFDNEADDEYLSENTVVDTEVLKKLNDRLKDEPPEDIEPEVIEEVMMAPPAAPPVPPAAISASAKSKVDQIHKLFDQPEDPSPETVSSEKTVILPDDELSGAPESKGAKLVVTAGPETGKEYNVEYNEIFVGRGVDNDFVVSDPSMSRKHFRIRRRFDEYIIVDLQSGNGTRVNGEKVTEQVLVNNDDIVVGRTTLRFVDLAAEQAMAITTATAPAPAPTPVAAAPVAPSVQPAPPKAHPKQEPKAAQSPVQQAAAPGAEANKPTPGARGNMAPVDARRSNAPIILEKSSGSSAGMIFGIVAVVVVVLALIAWQQFTKQAPTEPTPPAPAKVAVPEPPATPAAPSADVKIKELLAQADGLMQARNYAQAIDVYNEVLALDAVNPQATQQKSVAEREKANQAALNDAQQLFGTQEFDKASIRLRNIGGQSVFFADAQAMLLKIEDRKYAAGVEKGKSHLDKKQYDAAIAAFDGVLAMKADHPEAQKYKEIAIKERDQSKAQTAAERQRAEEARIAAQREREAKERKAEEARRAKAEEERRKKAEEEKRAKAEEERRKREAAEAAKRMVNGPTDLNTGISFYKQGQLDKAVGEFESIGTGRGDAKTIKKANALVGKIKQFRTVYNAGVAAHKAKDPIKAIPKLKDAMRLDRDISSGSSYAGELPDKIADMYFLVGNIAKQQEQWDKANTAYRRALAFSANHGPSKKGLEDLSKQAEKFYYRGFAIKDSDPDKARELWQLVLKLVPKGSDLYKRTQSSLDDL
jgi:tetratricopeptide (TPR) repeat protein